jgi:hypothetical protein
VSSQRILLRALLGSIAVSALLGIYAVLAGEFGDFEVKVLLTALAIAGASVLMMGSMSAASHATGRWRALVGVASAGAALVMVVPGLWAEIHADGWWQLAVSFSLIAVHCAHGSLLQLARLAPRYQWSRWASIALGALLVAFLLAVVWEVAEDDGIFQIISVVAILVSAATLAVGVFHWMSAVEVGRQDGAEVSFCPRCGKRLWQPAGEVRCHHCDARFFIELRAAGELPTAITRSR